MRHYTVRIAGMRTAATTPGSAVPHGPQGLPGLAAGRGPMRDRGARAVRPPRAGACQRPGHAPHARTGAAPERDQAQRAGAALGGLELADAIFVDAATAALGAALAERRAGGTRPVVVVGGADASPLALEGLYSAAQQCLKIVYVMLYRREFGSANKGGRHCPPLDPVSLARGAGCRAFAAHTVEEVGAVFALARTYEGPTVIGIPLEAPAARQRLDRC